MDENSNMDENRPVRLSPSDIIRLNKSKRKTRQINLSTWKDVSRKNLRDSGQEYRGRKSKTLVSAKTPPSNVSSNKENVLILNLSIKIL